MINKEVIEKLQSALKQIDEAQPLCPSPGCDILSNAGMNVDLALEILKEQPPASEYPDSEFTKVQRKAAQLAADAYEEDQEWCPTKTTRLLEACDRLDASEASRKELVDCLKELVDIIDSGSVMDTFTTQPVKAAIKANKQGKSGRREARK